MQHFMADFIWKNLYVMFLNLTLDLIEDTISIENNTILMYLLG